MSCDIHLRVETMTGEGWRSVSLTELDIPESWEERWEWQQRTGIYWSDRDYTLFTLLAGVRGTPLATPPLAAPRGVPFDASPEYRVDATGPDWHSHSYFTVGELWRGMTDRPIDRRAIFHEQWADFDRFIETGDIALTEIPGNHERVRAAIAETGKPPSDTPGYLAMEPIMGHGVRLPDGRVAYAAPEARPNEWLFLDQEEIGRYQPTMRWELFTWSEPYCDLWPNSFHRLLSYLVDRLGDPDGIRLVFHFDN